MTTSKDIVTLTNYIARYASHPPISEKRILEFDEIKNTVTWYYDPHEDDDIIDEVFLPFYLGQLILYNPFQFLLLT